MFRAPKLKQRYQFALLAAGISIGAPAVAEQIVIRFVGQVTEAACATATDSSGQRALTTCRSPKDLKPESWTTALQPGAQTQTSRATQTVKEVHNNGVPAGMLLTIAYY